MEFVDQEAPSSTARRSTRVAKLPQLVEAETEPVDGTTLLSRAGALLKRRVADANPSFYGPARPVDVLRVSGLFDIEERSGGAPESKVVRKRQPEAVSTLRP
jgi:hypothetical protein